MKFCLEGEIGGKASLAQVPHAARAVTGGSGVNGYTKRTLDTKNMLCSCNPTWSRDYCRFMAPVRSAIVRSTNL